MKVKRRSRHRAKVILLMFLIVTGSFIYYFYDGGINRFITVMKTGVEPLYRIETNKKIVCLTFNLDETSPETITKLVTVLKRYNTGATFFVSRNFVHKRPEELKKLKFERFQVGLLIGNSYASVLKDEQVIEQVKFSEQEIKKLGVELSKFFRPCKENFTGKSAEVMDLLGYKPVMWDVDADRVDSKNPGTWTAKVSRASQKGSIIKITATNGDSAQKMAALIEALNKKGLSSLSIKEALK